MSIKKDKVFISNGKDLEIRLLDNEVVIYATEKGLKNLQRFCDILIKKPKTSHIHLEDYEILSKNSLQGTIVLTKNENDMKLK